MESTIANSCQAVRQCQFRQTAATVESLVANIF